MHFQRYAMALLATVLTGSVASAQLVPTLQINCGGQIWNSGAPGTMNVTPNPTGGYNFTGSWSGSLWSGEWSGWFDSDPQVNFAIATTNNSGVTQTFISTLIVPTALAIPAPSTVFGGTSVTITGNGPATVAAVPGDFVYRALVGGVPVGAPLDLLGPPFSLATLTGLPNATGPINVGPAPGPALAAIDTIGIRHSFSLTAAGTATGNSAFIIIPAPASMLLLVGGALGLTRRRR